MFGGGSSSSVAKPGDIAEDAGVDGSSNIRTRKSEGKSSPSPERSKPASSSAPSPPSSSGPVPVDSVASTATHDKRRSKRNSIGGSSNSAANANANANASTSPPTASGSGGGEHKKRRSSGVSARASSLFASAKNSLRFGSDASATPARNFKGPLELLGRPGDLQLGPQGNSAGESRAGPRSTFRVGVWEDRNKRCRPTMEDTHSYLYNFLRPHAPPGSGTAGAAGAADDKESPSGTDSAEAASSTSLTAAADEPHLQQTDNGYFAIFDGHAGTFAADWCGKKLHLILEDIIHKNPSAPIPELLDQTFTSVDAQLETLPLKNSGCTAAIAVLRWEDRVPSRQSAPGSQGLAVAAAAAAAAEDVSEAAAAPEAKAEEEKAEKAETADTAGSAATDTADADVAQRAKLKPNASRQRVLYTANVGDARIVLCRGGKALRLSYDHKGSDENEGRRITNAGGLILHNRVNGVLAVTRALGDTYIKELVTGHPYTTETVIQPELDEFIILACDGLWDVCTDQDAVNLVRTVQDPNAAAKMLVDHALAHFSTDNLSCMIVRLYQDAAAQVAAAEADRRAHVGVQGDDADGASKPSEAEKTAEGGVPASRSSQGRNPASAELEPKAAAAKDDEPYKRTALDGPLKEEGDDNNDGNGDEDDDDDDDDNDNDDDDQQVKSSTAESVTTASTELSASSSAQAKSKS